MWKRFSSGQVGGLSARQYTEVQDVVAHYLSQLPQKSVPIQFRGRPIMVRLKEKVGSSAPGAGSVAGASRINAQAYKFKQIYVRVSESGGVEVAERSYSLTADPPEGSAAEQQLYAIDFDGKDYEQNKIVMIVPVDVDLGQSGTEVPDRQGIYAIISGGESGAVGVYTILSSQGGGTYSARLANDSTGNPVTITNLYEQSQYYGALLPPQNPCATLEPRPLGIGDRVFGFNWNGGLYTCAPTPFTVTCVNCGSNADAARAETFLQSSGDDMVAAIMLNG